MTDQTNKRLLQHRHNALQGGLGIAKSTLKGIQNSPLATHWQKAKATQILLDIDALTVDMQRYKFCVEQDRAVMAVSKETLLRKARCKLRDWKDYLADKPHDAFAGLQVRQLEKEIAKLKKETAK